MGKIRHHHQVTRHNVAQLTRNEMIEWLVWNDPNGCFTDDCSEDHGMDPMTKQECIDLIRLILERED